MSDVTHTNVYLYIIQCISETVAMYASSSNKVNRKTDIEYNRCQVHIPSELKPL